MTPEEIGPPPSPQSRPLRTGDVSQRALSSWRTDANEGLHGGIGGASDLHFDTRVTETNRGLRGRSGSFVVVGDLKG